MLDDLKKEFSSLKLLTVLITIAVGIYLLRFVLEFLTNFSDILLILIFGWLVSFILEPFVDLFTKYLKVPRVFATALVFIISALLIALIFLLFIPDIVAQINTLEKIIPRFLVASPPQVQEGVTKFINSFNNFTDYIPSLTQFFVNLVTVLILSFYLILDKQNLNKRLLAVTPSKYRESLKFIQSVIDSTFASFVRIQILWGVIGGAITWVVLTIFGVNYAASTSLFSGILTAVPVIGPIIGVIPPLIVALIDKPAQAIIIFLIIFLIQQFILNVFGPKLIGGAFNINPIIVMLSLLIGVKIAGFTGAVFAIPVISILIVVGREFYNHYFKDKEI